MRLIVLASGLALAVGYLAHKDGYQRGLNEGTLRVMRARLDVSRPGSVGTPILVLPPYGPCGIMPCGSTDVYEGEKIQKLLKPR